MLTENFKNINSENSNVALCIEGEFYTYSQLFHMSAQMYHLINDRYNNEKVIGVSLFNDLSTYASIIAVWASNKALVILDAEKSFEHNYNLVQKTQCRVILNSSDIIYDSIDLTDQAEILNTNGFFENEIYSLSFNLEIQNEFYYFIVNDFHKSNNLIQYKWNDVLIAFNSSAYFNFKLNSSDKFLSFFDFTHPLSIFTFLLSLNSGACFYTTPTKINRAFTTYSMVDEYQITFSFTTPYAIKQLEPFFEDITLWSLKYLFIAGDLLLDKHASRMLECASNAYIYNVGYSPFIFGMYSAYEIEDADSLITHDNIVSCGKPFSGYSVNILNPSSDELRPGEIGEFLIANTNVSYTTLFNNENGLLDDTVGNEYQMLSDDFKYKTGDVGFVNEDGLLMPVSTVFKQVVIDNIPLYLNVLEKQTRKLLHSNDVIAVIYKTIVGYEEIHLFVQNLSIDSYLLFNQLKFKVPDYLLPAQIHNTRSIPNDDNYFIDYNAIIKMLKEDENSFYL